RAAPPICDPPAPLRGHPARGLDRGRRDAGRGAARAAGAPRLRGRADRGARSLGGRREPRGACRRRRGDRPGRPRGAARGDVARGWEPDARGALSSRDTSGTCSRTCPWVADRAVSVPTLKAGLLLQQARLRERVEAVEALQPGDPRVAVTELAAPLGGVEVLPQRPHGLGGEAERPEARQRLLSVHAVSPRARRPRRRRAPAARAAPEGAAALAGRREPGTRARATRARRRSRAASDPG